MYKKLLPVLVVVLLNAACKKEGSVTKTPQVNPVQGTIKADWGDTITISGKNLPPDVAISFNKIPSLIVSNDGQNVRCVIPVFSPALTASVLIKYSADSTLLKDYITLNAPIISSFTATQALGDTVVIKGDHFHIYNLQVKFGDAPASVVLVSKKLLKAVVPNEIKNTRTSLTVNSQLQTATASSSFVLLKPAITAVTPGAFIGGIITVTIPQFRPLAAYTVYLDNQLVSYQSKNVGSFTIQLPYKVYAHHKTTLSMRFLDYNITWPTDIVIKDNWVMVSDTIPFSAQGSFPLNIGAELYTLARMKVNDPDQSTYLWHLNQNDYSWSQVGRIPVPVYRAAANGSKIYFYTEAGPNNFYECDPVTAACTAKANFIGQPRFQPSIFYASGKLYIGAGLQEGTGALYPTDDWYAYTPSTNQWTRMADMRVGATDAVQSAHVAVINNIAYLVGGEGYKCYRYAVATNTWSTMPDMIETRVDVGVVVYNQKLYTLKGGDYPDNGDLSHDVFRYDPISNQWAYVPFQIDPYQLEDNVAFVTGGKIYMLSYDAYGLKNKLYEGTSLP
jgi:N-acetylneuraminic acid mutarotase